MSYNRVKGGEKNLNSGVRWTKKEIIQVYLLYKKLNGVGLHEHNPEIQSLAVELGRTVRSTEAQTLMFRNLERSGAYSHGNMNKLSKQVWIEFESTAGAELENKKIKKSQKVDSKYLQANDELVFDEENEEDYASLKYAVWNEKLVNHFFNENFSEIEIGCFPVSEELFQEITDYNYSYEDFVFSLRIEISSDDFFTHLKKLYDNSIPREYNGRNIRKPIPDYFGMLMFLILALSEDEGENMTVANVYDRINNYGQEVFSNKWSDITSSVSRDNLEPIWESLEEWSTHYLKRKKGSFIRRNPKSKQRKYVSRIERHSLFNSKQFTIIIDLLIADGFRPETYINPQNWISFFKKHAQKITQSVLILEYISDGSPLQSSVVAFLNNYLKNHFTNESIASERGIERTPPLKLKICFKSIPMWPEDPIEEVFYRVSSDNLQEDVIVQNAIKFKIRQETIEFSNSINASIKLEDGAMFKGNVNRYMTSKEMYWLGKNHKLNEWIELDQPTNDQSIILIGPQEAFTQILSESSIQSSQFAINNHNSVAVRFKNLDEFSFEKVYSLYNPYTKIEGKIELISVFTGDRRKCIYKEFNPKFRYVGPSVDPTIVALSTDDKKQLVELIQVEEEGHKYYTLPSDFNYPNFFRVYEKGGKIKSRYNLYYGDLNSTAKNIHIPFPKDHEGLNQVEIEIKKMDILDIPESFNRDYDVTLFNEWHSNLFNLFKGVKDLNYKGDESSSTEFLNRKGDLLLQFVALSHNITTYDFPKLIKELDPSISSRFCKKIMIYWRNLGYIDFQDYGQTIKINPTSIIFLQTKAGLKGFLSGYRNEQILNQLKAECKALHIDFSIVNHSSYKNEVYPSKVVLFDKRGNIDKYQKLKDSLGLHFVNNLQNSLNPEYVVYQLACFYTQKSVSEFKLNLEKRITYNGDHHRKRWYDAETLHWTDTTQDVDELEDGTVVRYEGFRDNSMIHVIRSCGKNKIINDVSLAVFSTLSGDEVKKQSSQNQVENYDLFVPFFLGLPFWIERGLIMLNAELPELKKHNNINYRLYRNINKRIIEVLKLKLDQNISEL